MDLSNVLISFLLFLLLLIIFIDFINDFFSDGIWDIVLLLLITGSILLLITGSVLFLLGNSHILGT